MAPSKRARSPARASPKPKASRDYAANPVICGEAWWLDDPATAKREAWALRSKGLRRYFLCLLGCVMPYAAVLVFYGPEFIATPRQIASAQDGVPDVMLAAYRVAAAVFAVFWTIALYFTDMLAEFENLDRVVVNTRICKRTLWRYQGFTQWSWLAIVVFFCASAFCSVSVLMSPDDPSHNQPTLAANVAVVSLQVAWPFALLTTIVVTFVLVPTKFKRGLKQDGFFAAQNIAMHNHNVALVLVELLLDQITPTVSHLPFAPMFGLAYLIYHNSYRYAKTRTLLYFFLNWQGKHALKILICLALGMSAFFVFGLVVVQLRDSAVGVTALLAGARFIMRFRPMTKPPPSYEAPLKEEAPPPEASADTAVPEYPEVVKLTTYNVLLDGLEEQMENSRKTPWSKRLLLVADKINECKADILCLQEINQQMFEQLRPQITCRSYVAFLGKTGEGARLPMNNAIFFDPNVFQLLPIKVKYDEWECTFPDIAEPALIHPDCTQWRCATCLLEHIATRKAVCVQAVHLPSGEEQSDEDYRVSVLEDELKLFSSGVESDVHVVCGDFNSTKDLGYRNKVHPLMSRKKYSNAVANPFPTYNDWTAATFDYVYVKPKLPTHPVVDPAAIPIPNETEGSDHKPLSVYITL